jgi:hypothetical protein
MDASRLRAVDPDTWTKVLSAFLIAMHQRDWVIRPDSAHPEDELRARSRDYNVAFAPRFESP